jgi:hypothetical protein
MFVSLLGDELSKVGIHYFISVGIIRIAHCQNDDTIFNNTVFLIDLDKEAVFLSPTEG